MRSALAASVLALLVTASHAASPAFTGNDVLKICGPDPDRPAPACKIMLRAIMDGIEWGRGQAWIRAQALPGVSAASESIVDYPLYCGKGVTNDQLVDVVIKAIREHPDARHFPAAALTSIALETYFPCPR